MTPPSPAARLRRAIFARHCNPWSAWTRWASTPLILVPVWTRRRSHAALLALWFAANPFVFGRPAHQRAWSTRAMLGEELWISRRSRDAAMLVSAMTSACALTGRRRRLASSPHAGCDRDRGADVPHPGVLAANGALFRSPGAVA
ncbi:DUF6653 family protein [Mycobacterium sp. 852002-50816_SCH5313054-b]|uniref:DUF6653 family protein n=1 Tax=Mycobacterium sp. 852002-50816_SCH5313054-b TaxID=1834092 RepID=UPI000A7F2B2B